MADPTEADEVPLLDQLSRAVRARAYSRRTEEAYAAWVRRFIVFHDRRHPSLLGPDEVTAFLTSLAVDGEVSPATQNQALAALLFLYRHVLKLDLPWLSQVVRAKPARRLPVVLNRDEVFAVLSKLRPLPRLQASLLYGAGLRLMELLRLRHENLRFCAILC